ncbi:lantibiotic dehydratase [Streptomyces sp. 372A]
MTECRAWMEQAWAVPGVADAVKLASPLLAARTEQILGSSPVPERRVRRAAMALMRYVLRATGRPTPFGLFAGVAPLEFGSTPSVLHGTGHFSIAKVDAAWLADVVRRFEACPELLERLHVVFSDLAVRSGERMELARGPGGVTIRHTSAVRVSRSAAAAPLLFAELIGRMAEEFPDAGQRDIRLLLSGLVKHGFLVSSLHAPLTVPDPLTYLIDRLRAAGADAIETASALLHEIEAVHMQLAAHNRPAVSHDDQLRRHESLSRRMRGISPAGRSPLAVDLFVDRRVRMPRAVVRELEKAASTLVRLSRRPTGAENWREYHSAFCERYGTDVLVPLRDVVNRDFGLGYPGGYRTSTRPGPGPGDRASERDQRLLALAWSAALHDSREIALTEKIIQTLAGDRPAKSCDPPHVELSARIRATDLDALADGEFTLAVAPARSAGVLTGRFAPNVAGAGLSQVYRSVPTTTAGAVPVQVTCPPADAELENVCRVPAYLPLVLPLGQCEAGRPVPDRDMSLEESDGPADGTDVLTLDDLAVLASYERLFLVSVKRRQVVEPEVFHALALEAQLPPLVRFLVELPRAFDTVWGEFDWGPQAARLPYLPRVRHGRSVLSPARWHLTPSDLPAAGADPAQWHRDLTQWRSRWKCPAVTELRHGDRTMRLNLDEPAHAAVVRDHLLAHPRAVLTETEGPQDFGWIGGYAHEVVLPLFTQDESVPTPMVAPQPVLLDRRHGQLPGAPETHWLFVKIFARRERHADILAERMPRLLGRLDASPPWWFVRYRSPGETDHLRLRIRTDAGQFGVHAAVVGQWAERLRDDGLITSVSFDVYRPEVGRYGPGPAMEAAESVFAADSALVAGLLRHVTSPGEQVAWAALNLIDIVQCLLGSLAEAMSWLAGGSAPAGPPVERNGLRNVIRWISGPGAVRLDALSGEVAEARRQRSAALRHYQAQRPDELSLDVVLESLLHMHCNRLLGLDRKTERICRKMARQAAVTWLAQRERTGSE